MRVSVPTALSKQEARGFLFLTTNFSPILYSFIANEVGPMNDLLGQDVHVNFVAYGNADTIDVDGGYEFKCQHGEDECYGNFVQACTEAHAPDYDTGLR